MYLLIYLSHKWKRMQIAANQSACPKESTITGGAAMPVICMSEMIR